MKAFSCPNGNGKLANLDAVIADYFSFKRLM